MVPKAPLFPCPRFAHFFSWVQEPLAPYRYELYLARPANPIEVDPRDALGPNGVLDVLSAYIRYSYCTVTYGLPRYRACTV